MQRIGFDHHAIGAFGFLVFLVVYESLSTLYLFLPPLFGFLLAMLVKNRLGNFLFTVLIYFLFFEADRDYFIFSTWVYLLFFYRVLMPLIEDNLVCQKCILVMSVVVGYIGYFLFLNLVYFLVGADIYAMEYYLIGYYILIEAFLVLLLL